MYHLSKMVRGALLLNIFGVALGSIDRGVLMLDNITFDRVVGGNHAAFVRVDKEYSYGDGDDAFRELAKEVGESTASVLIGQISVSEPPSNRRGEDHYGICTAPSCTTESCARQRT